MIALLLFAVTVHAQNNYSRGEYIARAASCRECHTIPGQPAYSGGAPLVAYLGPFKVGVFYPPNITPDEEYGIGKWSREDFKRALRLGISPQHKLYYPSFPYRSFTKMFDADIEALFTHLFLQAPVNKPNRAHELNAPFNQRWLLNFWQALFFQNPGSDKFEDIKTAVGPFRGDPDKSLEWNHGAYLVEAILHCTECHTPRNQFGALVSNLWMAGSDLVFSGHVPPNITPDPETGITWSKKQWEDFLASGIDPQGRSPGVEMALAVRATSGLTRSDRAAVVEYLTSLPKVHRQSKEASP